METKPTSIKVQWQSGRIERYETRFSLRPACQLVRALSECSSNIERAWLEDECGALVYVAVNGQGLPARHASEVGPMA